MSAVASNQFNNVIHPNESKSILVVGGPAGSGKSTVAAYLSKALHLPYLEGDSYHTPGNRAKMESDVPLTDADRWDWLIVLRKAATKCLESSNSVVVTCSTLKRRYRDVFRIASYNQPQVRVCFIYLKLDETELRARVAGRIGHYMKESMVHSQVASLEPPAPDESDVIQLSTQEDQASVCKDALAQVCLKLNRSIGEFCMVDYSNNSSCMPK